MPRRNSYFVSTCMATINPWIGSYRAWFVELIECFVIGVFDELRVLVMSFCAPWGKRIEKRVQHRSQREELQWPKMLSVFVPKGPATGRGSLGLCPLISRPKQEVYTGIGRMQAEPNTALHLAKNAPTLLEESGQCASQNRWEFLSVSSVRRKPQNASPKTTLLLTKRCASRLWGAVLCRKSRGFICTW